MHSEQYPKSEQPNELIPYDIHEIAECEFEGYEWCEERNVGELQGSIKNDQLVIDCLKSGLDWTPKVRVQVQLVSGPDLVSRPGPDLDLPSLQTSSNSIQDKYILL